jgi:hypothetical protein
MLRYLLAWFPMLVLAIANGALRQATYGKRIPDTSSRPQSAQRSLAFTSGS